MYLFTKRTRNIIKGIWAVVALLVMISMVLTYSGFTRLSNSQQIQPIEVSPEDLASTTSDSGPLSTSSPEVQDLLKSIQANVASSSQTQGQRGAAPVETIPEEPPVPQLNFGI